MRDNQDMASGRAAHEPSPDGLGHSVGIPDALSLSTFRIVTLQLSQRDGHLQRQSISQHYGYFASEAEAVGNAVSRVPEIKPGFSVDQYLVASPFAQGTHTRRAETTGSVEDGGPVRKDAPKGGQNG